MPNDNTAVVVPFIGAQKVVTPSSVSVEPVASVVLQGSFVSEDDCQAFLQAVTMHGITLLRCANSPLPKPSIDDLSTIEKFSRALARIWPRPSIVGGGHD